MASLKTFALSTVALTAYATEAGKTASAGQRSLLELGRAIYASVKVNGLEDGDIGPIYAAYAAGQNASTDALTPKVDTTNKTVMANGTSKLRVFAKLARCKGKGEFFNVVPMTVKTVGKGVAYEQVLKVARAQIAACADGATRPFSESEIKEVLNPPAKALDVIEELTRIRKGVTARYAEGSKLNAIEQAPFVELAKFLATQIAALKAGTVGSEEIQDFDADEDDSDAESESLESELESLAA